MQSSALQRSLVRCSAVGCVTLKCSFFFPVYFSLIPCSVLNVRLTKMIVFQVTVYTAIVEGEAVRVLLVNVHPVPSLEQPWSGAEGVIVRIRSPASCLPASCLQPTALLPPCLLPPAYPAAAPAWPGSPGRGSEGTGGVTQGLAWKTPGEWVKYLGRKK